VETEEFGKSLHIYTHGLVCSLPNYTADVWVIGVSAGQGG